MEFDNIIFRMSNGGIGKVICSTVVIRAIKKKYPDKKIITVTGNPEIFFNNPNVDEWHHGNLIPKYFGRDMFRKSKSLILEAEPYINIDYIYREKHISQAWCESLGLEMDNVKPDLFFTNKEKRDAETLIKERTKGKPLMLMQINGGGIPMQGQPVFKQWVRSLPVDIAQQVADAFKDKYHIMMVKLPPQPTLKGVDDGLPIQVPVGCGVQQQIFNPRMVLSWIPHAEKILCIDSFLQHACGALNKKAVVLWGGTDAKVLGYDTNVNITNGKCKACHLPNCYLNEPNWDCEKGEICMDFDAEEIIKALGG